MASQWSINEGDFGDVKELDIQDENGNPKDLSGKSAAVIVWSESPDNILFTATAVVVVPETGGKVQWTTGSADAATLDAGSYVAGVRVYQAGVYQKTYQVALLVSANA